MSNARHKEALTIMERRAENLLEAEKAYKSAAQELYAYYAAGFGTDEDRDKAEDHLEDAELIPRRHLARW